MNNNLIESDFVNIKCVLKKYFVNDLQIEYYKVILKNFIKM